MIMMWLWWSTLVDINDMCLSSNSKIWFVRGRPERECELEVTIVLLLLQWFPNMLALEKKFEQTKFQVHILYLTISLVSPPAVIGESTVKGIAWSNTMVICGWAPEMNYYSDNLYWPWHAPSLAILCIFTTTFRSISYSFCMSCSSETPETNRTWTEPSERQVEFLLEIVGGPTKHMGVFQL
jgi:hypothetical protein